MPAAQDVALQVALRRRDVETFRTVPAFGTEGHGDLGERVGDVAASEAVETEVARRKPLEN